MKILGVETSCDETAAAVVTDGRTIHSNIISSQIETHRPYGGVVPELASRQHLQLIDAVVSEALTAARTRYDELDAVAGTYGPGLSTSLLIGLNAAKGVALSIGKPFIGINHLEAHLYSPLLAASGTGICGGPRLVELGLPVNTSFPMISLIVSGGHTILTHCTAIGQYALLGQTLDDAAGEAFDKVAKLLKLGYPGGPEIDRCARQGNRAAIDFPRGMLDDPSYNFSFSGLKTAVLYYLRKHRDCAVPDVCASFQEAVVDVLVGKTIRAATALGVRSVSASGGVSVNSRFRERLAAACAQRGLELFLAPASLCTDNAAMIASLAYYKLQAGATNDFALEVAPSCGLGKETL